MRGVCEWWQTLREHPEIASVPIPRIVYITGLERSGTTLLHNLFALHCYGRALLRWELMEPVPPPEVQTYATDARIGTVQASVDKLRGSTLEHMHWVNADEPEECVWGFIDAVSMLGQPPACACHSGGGSSPRRTSRLLTRTIDGSCNCCCGNTP